MVVRVCCVRATFFSRFFLEACAVHCTLPAPPSATTNDSLPTIRDHPPHSSCPTFILSLSLSFRPTRPKLPFFFLRFQSYFSLPPNFFAYVSRFWEKGKELDALTNGMIRWKKKFYRHKQAQSRECSCTQPMHADNAPFSCSNGRTHVFPRVLACRLAVLFEPLVVRM